MVEVEVECDLEKDATDEVVEVEVLIVVMELEFLDNEIIDETDTWMVLPFEVVDEVELVVLDEMVVVVNDENEVTENE